MTRKPNLRRLFDSWSAKAFWLLAGMDQAARSLPEFAQYLPPRIVTGVALAAILLRVFVPSKSR